MRAKASRDIARVLVDNGADIECLNRQSQTPLHSFFNPVVLELARQHSQCVDTISTDVRGMTLAHYFSWTNLSLPVDFQLFEHDDEILHARDATGRTPLHLASQRGNISVMSYLLSQLEGVNWARSDAAGNTPMHEAVKSSRAPEAIELLGKNKLSISSKNSEGHTPLQHAALWGTVAAISDLLSRDPMGIHSRDDRGRGLLALARETENENVASWLLENHGQILASDGRIVEQRAKLSFVATRKAMLLIGTGALAFVALLVSFM